MPARVPLPPHLRGAAFHVSHESFHELTPGRLRSADLDVPFHGVRSVGLRIEEALDRARMYAPRLRKGQLFCHLTAAQLLGIPLPLHLESSSEVHIGTVGGTRTRTRGAVGHVLRFARPYPIGELAVTLPADTWCQIASCISREDLVAAGDFLISGRRLPGGKRATPLCSMDDLADAFQRFGRQPGAAAIRWALPRLRPNVDSPRESLLRLILVAARLPEPTVAHPVPVEGGLILHPDLSYPAAKLAIEYEGDEHRSSKKRWRADLRRTVLLEEAGWRVIHATDDDIKDPTVIVRAIRKALRTAATPRP
ncbi:MAG: endonuclease domain-containing protein [Humibacter sp.]